MTQIDALHARLGRAESLADYVRGLAAIGVVHFESFVADGHSEFYAADGRRVASPPHHEMLAVAEHGDRDVVVEHLRRHGEGETSYVRCPPGLREAASRSGWPTRVPSR